MKCGMIIFFFSLVALIAGAYIITNWKKEQYVKVPEKTVIKEVVYYESHCWFCGSDIDSRNNSLCPKCNKYYICKDCNKCLCDKNEYDLKNQPGEINKKWIKTGVKELLSGSQFGNSTGHCRKCGKLLRGNTLKELCTACWREQKRPTNKNIRYGYCQQCGKKLSGDRSKKLCYQCYKKI